MEARILPQEGAILEVVLPIEMHSTVYAVRKENVVALQRAEM